MWPEVGDVFRSEFEELLKPVHWVLSYFECENENGEHQEEEYGQAEYSVCYYGVDCIAGGMSPFNGFFYGFFAGAGYEAVSSVGDDGFGFVCEDGSKVVNAFFNTLPNVVVLNYFYYFFILFEQFYCEPSGIVFFNYLWPEILYYVVYFCDFFFDFPSIGDVMGAWCLRLSCASCDCVEK